MDMRKVRDVRQELDALPKFWEDCPTEEGKWNLETRRDRAATIGDAKVIDKALPVLSC
jgi:hypothetical protein